MEEWNYRYKNTLVKDVEIKNQQITRMGGKFICKQ